MVNTEQLTKGTKVHYAPKHRADIENGIVKDVTEAGVFVVYNCGDDWDNYENYTAALTNPKDLQLGWG